RLPPDHYRQCRQRNPETAHSARKYRDRLQAIAPLLGDGARVIELGCADGAFGAMVKAERQLTYVGVEVSEDAVAARTRLDRVADSLDGNDDGSFDLALAFHVIEHLATPADTLAVLRRQLVPDGKLVLEVPNGAGHPLRDDDTHPEHLHLFSPGSLTLLLTRSGFAVESMQAGCFESQLYPDCLRVVAAPARSPEEKRVALLDRFRRLLPGRFIVHGIGGDFRNYVLPLLGDLDVVALCDSDPSRHGETHAGLVVGPYDAVRFAGLPILIASARHADDIRTMLVREAPPQTCIVDLEEIYGAD
ncbi:MAG: class I SAM-dependent methyltransferase, partial [Candidatus Accumulibacter sp.]|uniref:class I SAM-dependent methyltransferase n=1 Tax=Accumulibacter sp. TaxID=2053492 RepID=UPI002879EB82